MVAFRAMFKEGDVVREKSGGSPMVVTGVSGNRVSCMWFADKEQRTGDFEADALQIIENSPPHRRSIDDGPWV